MSKGKSIRILALFALLAAIAYAVIVRCERRPGPVSSGGGGTTATDESLDLVLAREIGAAWYCEGDTVQGAWAKAEESLRRVAESRAATPQDLVNLAAVKLKLFADDTEKQNAQTSEIKALAQRALERDPKLATAHFLLGAIAMDRENDFEAAKRSFEQAVENAPHDVSAKLRFADALNETGERDRAIDVYRSVRELGPEFAGAFHMTATYRLARLLRQRKQGSDVEESRALTQEHTQRSSAGAANPSDEEIKLGTLGRVIIPPSSGATGAPPATAPAIAFHPLPPLLADRLVEVTALAVADVDGDQREDVLAAGSDAAGKATLVALRQSEAGALEPLELGAGVELPTPIKRIVVVDLENEFGLSVLIAGGSGLALLSPAPDGSGGWIDGTAQLPLLPPVRDVQPVDFGHDGHVDLAFATAQGLKLVRNDGVPRDQYTRERTGAVQLVDVSAEAGMPTNALAWVAIEDFDLDQDVDLIAGGAGTPTTILSSLRRGRFEAIDSARSGLPDGLAARPLFADLDHDGRPDLLATGDAPGFARNLGEGRFAPLQPLPALAEQAGPGVLADVDLDGELDLVRAGPDGTVMARLGALQAGSGATIAIGGTPLAGTPPALADLDDDGDLDLVTPAGPGKPGIVVRCGDVGASAHSLLLQMRGVKDNRQAIGATIEVRAGRLYQRRFATASEQLFGLAGQETADVVRISWPNGVVQCWVRPASSDPALGPRACGASSHPARAPQTRTLLKVIQKEGLVGSCPFLYSWNGREYVFVSDVLGTTPLGLPMTESLYVPPDHDELVRVTSAELAPIEREYRFQLTEELREVTYLDRAQLWVVDHEAGVEVHPEERFSFPPFPPQTIHAMKRILPLRRALDQEGRDWTAQLAAIDRKHAVPFEPMDSRYQGLATHHVLELELPAEVKDAARVRFLMTGWFFWTDASVNVLADRNGSIRFVPPTFSVPDGAGGWRECGPPVGFPAGKTKTMVLDVTSMLNRDDPRLRIASTLRLYWDCIRVALDARDEPVTVTKLEPKLADLRYRGFSKPVNEDHGEEPASFQWGVLEELPRWNQHSGMLTRCGDVLPLLGAIDDRFVIFSAGDAIDLRFDASSTPPRPGTARTYLLYLDGWAKDADPNTTFSQTVEPLPFHGMSGYPYRADERYPDDDLHLDYLLEWNTRPGRRLIASLAMPIPVEPNPQAPQQP